MKFSNFKRLKLFSSRFISILSLFIFLLIILIIFLSNRYMDNFAEKERQAQQNRNNLSQLGEKLADTSDYLTDEARKFAVNGNMEHFYNYWHEVNVTKTRDNVISELQGFNPPNDEEILLSDAKEYSDMLINTETISMKLKLLSKDINISDYSKNKELYRYINWVMEYELPIKYSNLAKSQMESKAVEILFDFSYNEYKSMIMSPIDKFQSVMKLRLDREVEKAIKGKDTASLIQIYSSGAVLIFIGILLIGLYFLYIKPLKEYSNVLADEKIMSNLENQNFSEIRVVPKGSYELYSFGEIFNRLSLILHNEINKHSEAEEKMRIARDEADRANNAKSEFFAQMSHELRTPLNAITGYLYLLKNTSLDNKQQKYCRNIEMSSENLLGLINNVLDFSKIESGNMVFESVDFNLYELLEEVYNIMENIASQKNIAIKLDIINDIPKFLKGDSLKLKQVLINLINNGIKFTQYGEVVLSVKYEGDIENKVLLQFCVKDTGIGIEKENISKIFDPFIQEDAGVTRKYGGTGLGLAISQMIVENASKGKYKINVDSQINKGSSFYFNMEFYYGKEVSKEVYNYGNLKDLQSNKSKIMLVDDNEINLEIETEILKSYGVEVIGAKSGKEAINIAENEKVDLILLDLHMPQMDGYETAKILRENTNYKFTPIIALTADVVSGVEEKVMKSGMNDYISKPFKAEKLRNIIEKYLNIVKNEPNILYSTNNTVFDYNTCLNNLKGNKTILNNILISFINTHSKSLSHIKSHIKEGNYNNAKSIIHDIKGISGNLNCNKLYDISSILNRELADKKYDSINLFEEIWEETLLEIKKHIKEEEIYETGIVLNNKMWNKFLSLCKNWDISALNYFEEYRGAFKKAFNKEDFNKIEEYVRKYEFTKILYNFENIDF
ncbi:MAG: response regulator [Lachnospirales bacterium]